MPSTSPCKLALWHPFHSISNRSPSWDRLDADCFQQELVTIPSLKITMHRVFFIPELLDQIFQNFRTDFDEKKLVSTIVPEISSYENFLPNGKTCETLLNAALTCRAFKKPALDVLWWAMDDLTPLFCLLRGYGIVEPDDYEYVSWQSSSYGFCLTQIVNYPIPDRCY